MCLRIVDQQPLLLRGYPDPPRFILGKAADQDILQRLAVGKILFLEIVLARARIIDPGILRPNPQAAVLVHERAGGIIVGQREHVHLVVPQAQGLSRKQIVTPDTLRRRQPDIAVVLQKGMLQ